MKKSIVFFVCVLVAFLFAPVQNANAQSVWDGSIDDGWYDDSQSDFYIYTAEELAGLASLVNSNTSNFSGKTIHLEADIWLNNDNENTNHWTMIGGCSQSTGEISGTIRAFCGTFHGGGHTIYNMYCDNSGYFQAGLFGNLQYPGSIDSLILVNPVTIANGMMGALVGFVGNNTNSGNGTVNISECMVINENVQGVNTSSNNNVGGLVGATYPNKQSGGYCATNISHCIVTGSILGQYVGGIVGNSQGGVCSNCYFAGNITSSYATGGICGYSGTVNNCFSTFSGSNSSGNGTQKSLSYMQGNAFLGDLDSHFKFDFCDFNNGLPVLSWIPCDDDPDCGTVSSIQISNVSGASATISWSPSPYGTPNGYYLEYSVQGEENWQSEYSSETQITLSGLEPSTTYDLRIMTECEEGSSDWQTTVFATRCLVSEDFSIGNGTGTTYNFPVDNFYRYTYSQQIFTAEELGNTENNISGISFQYAYSSPSTDKNDVNIYLGHTTKSTFSSASDYESYSNLQLVYSGPLNCTQGWNRFDFDTPFMYDGMSNLVVAVDDNSNAYNGNSYTFNVHSTNGTMTIAYHSDSNNPDPSNPPTGSSYSTRNNVKIHYCSNGTCAAPTITVSNATENSADVEWVPGYQESTWELRYKPTSDQVWIEEGYVYGDSYSLSNLSPSTHYTVQMRAICDDPEPSSWTSANFKTECGPIFSFDLPWSTNFDEEDYSSLTEFNKYPDCWNRLQSDPNHYAYIYNSTYSHSAPNALDFHYTQGCYDMAIMPALGDDVNASELMLTFYLYKTAASVIMEIGVMEDKDDVTTFEVLDTLNTAELNTWEYVMYPFAAYAGYGKYIAFRVSNGNSCTYRIDDLTLDYTPTCLQPLNVTIDNVNATFADVTWTDVNGAMSWIVEYDTAGFVPGNGMTVTTNSYPIQLTDLNSNYTYDVYVMAVCGSGEYSNYSEKRTFTTQICDAIDQCDYTLNLHDSYGDGWNGNRISIYSDNILVATYTVPSSSHDATFQVGLCDQSNVRFVWQAGSYPSETSFEILDPFEDVIYSCTDGSTLSSGATLSNFTVSCSAQTCLKPTNVTASVVTTNSLDLSWTARNGESSWEVVYGDANFDPETSGYTQNVTGTPSTVLTGLTPATTYDIYVKAYCDDSSESMWSTKITVTTECDALPYPFFEDFDAGTMPNCWNQNFIMEEFLWEVNVPYSNPSSAHSGSYVVSFSPEEYDYSTELISPIIDMNGAVTPELSFWYVNHEWAGDQDELTVLYRASSADAWTELGNYSSDVSSWTYVTLALPENLSTCQICFRAYSNYGHGIHLDDISINEAGTPPSTPCAVPTGLTSSNVQQTSANVSWNAGDASVWNLRYRAQNESWNTFNYITSNSNVLTGLTAQTTYEVQVQTICTDDVSDWSAIHSFTTTATPVDGCDAPTDLLINSITETSAVAVWNANGASSWKVGYKPQNSDQWQEATVSSNTYNMNGLTANTTYDFHVKTLCADNESEYVVTTFTTTGVGIDNHVLANNLVLAPNPADNFIEVAFKGDAQIKEVAVFNAYGQLMEILSMNGSQCIIHLDNYAAGIYFVRVTGDSGVAIKKFIRK